jgi:hypothetical protein
MLLKASPTRRVLLVIALLELLIVVVAFMSSDTTTTTLQTIARFSGRLSLAVFTFIFLFSLIRQELLTQWLSKDFYAVMAFTHGIHLIELLSYVAVARVPLIPYRVAGGFFAYVFIFIMPFAQRQFERQNISVQKFNMLQQVYLYYVWLIFFLSYLPRVLGKLPNAGGTFAEHVTLFTVVIALLLFRLIRIFRQPKAGMIS